MLVVFTIFIISFVTLFNRYQSKKYDYNPTLFVFLVESTKCLVMFCVLKFYYKRKEIQILQNKEYFTVATLYFFTNVMLITILQNISAGSFMVLSQHRILWVASLSIIILKRRYASEQKIACLLNLIGVVMVVIMKKNSDETVNTWV